MSEADPFGFSTAKRVAEKISEIKPEPEALGVKSKLASLDRVAEKHGFPSRQAPEEKLVRRRRDVGPSAQLNVKCPIPIYNRFIRFCDQERLSYWEGLERLLEIGEERRGKARRDD